MKKISIVLMLFLLVITGCNQDETKKEAIDPAKVDSEQKNAETDNESIEVDKNLLSVEITLPASFLGLDEDEKSIDQVIAEAKADGISEVIQNEDGSLTYKMSKSKHKEMLSELETEMKTSIEDIISGEDFASVKDITHNKKFSEFRTIVNRDEFENSFDGFVTMSLGVSGMLYQIFDGVDPEKNKVTISIEDEATGEVFETVVYPDDLEEE
ncbi:hypothetical protein ACFFF5_17860 [Lederbergia wuyishanensis]|uniref:Antigen I/II N-terminal domain-containing protein n=1 Tax=Lederbergia wuyishanensis TaxID=1347903 RepID=A0ABU0D4H6_9BACI|nr:hypothetical protein [Lederbergia wuyishanensis]MCJ8008107.1 hypothetical protein [Lederbergia wuyishanensis]MDQ0343307.1 hypothetical protein [Lederbergia wuyishanensis]